MHLLFYARLIGFTAGTLVYLFLLALILGHRRPRLFERLLFFLLLGMFLIYAGNLLEANSDLQYGPLQQSSVAQNISEGLEALGFLLLVPLVWHVHYGYPNRRVRGSFSSHAEQERISDCHGDWGGCPRP